MNENNPYRDLVEASRSEPAVGRTVAEVEEARASQEVQAAIVSAKRFPRDEIRATDRILNACTRASLAEAATYAYSRGGTEVTGPSIRLAEVIAQQWGNMDFGVRELAQRAGSSTVQAYAWDLETNVRETRTFEVPHKVKRRDGSWRDLSDPRDVYEHVANQGARRLRACILAIVPSDVTEAATTQCVETLRKSVDASPDALRRMIEAFGKLGVSQADIVEWAGVRLEAIRPAQLVRLRSIYQSLADGMSEPGDWFAAKRAPRPEDAASRSVALRERLAGGETGEASGPAPTAPTEQERASGEGSQNPPSDALSSPEGDASPTGGETTGEPAPADTGEQGQLRKRFDAMLRMIGAAGDLATLDDLERVADEKLRPDLGPAWKGQLTKALKERREALG